MNSNFCIILYIEDLIMTKRFCFISDTHNRHKKLNMNLEGVDFLIHTGDFTAMGKEKDVHRFNKWIGTLGLDKEHVIIIAGNHDWFFARHDRKRIEEVCSNFTYLQEDRYECDGVKFYGAPHQPQFYNWAFNVPRGEKLKAIWDKIPEDTDVLLTHGPPIGILDANQYGELCGCEDLLNRVNELNLKVHAFGHIHEGRGLKEINGTAYINSAIVNEHYESVHEPVIMDIEF